MKIGAFDLYLLATKSEEKEIKKSLPKRLQKKGVSVSKLPKSFAYRSK